MESLLHGLGIDAFCFDCRLLLAKLGQSDVEVRHAILEFGQAVGGLLDRAVEFRQVGPARMVRRRAGL